MITFISVRAQSQLPLSDIDFSRRNALNNYSSFNDSDDVHKNGPSLNMAAFLPVIDFLIGEVLRFSATNWPANKPKLNDHLYALAGILQLLPT